MPSESWAVSASIDSRWLEDQARHDPVSHAYAIWDLEYAPDRVEFRVLQRGGVPTSYLLIWHGVSGTMVHWVGDGPADPLLAALPARPLVAVVPEDLGSRVVEARSPARAYPILLMTRPAGAGPLPPRNPRVRRLSSGDAVQLREFAEASDDVLGRAYARAALPENPPIPESIWGAFEGERLVGVASTHVKLASIWVLGGIYVHPAHRGRGLGRDLTRTAVAEADAAGAWTALYVREDNAPAVRAYERVGFRTASRRAWVDAGGNRAP